MPGKMRLQDVFEILYWPHSMAAEMGPDGNVGMCYRWRCGCSALESPPQECIVSWCAQHAEAFDERAG